MLFDRLLSREQSEDLPRINLVLCDYNLPVLRLSAIPNLLLMWCAHQSLLTPGVDCDLDIDSDLCNQFMLHLKSHNIEVTCIAGAWTPQLTSMIPRQPPSSLIPVKTVVLASETIYSPATIPSFTDTLLSLLRDLHANQQLATGLVAAKRVYFGVGGGVDEFVKVLQDHHAESQVVWENKEAGIGRVILEVHIGYI